MDMLCDVLCTSEDIVIHRLDKEKDFIDIDGFLGSFYRKYPRIEGFHIFSCDKNSCTNNAVVVKCKEYDVDNSFATNVNMIKRGFYGRSNHCSYPEALRFRKQYITNYAIKVIAPPELNPYKQVELYTKI